jgi:SAM-dependent methyltransferase
VFDVAVSTQVYEYVPDMPAALAEVYRVLRLGGRVVILDTDWDSIVWAAGDQARMQRLLAAWAERFADPHLPRSLSWRLQGAGFHVERREVLVLFNPEYDPDTYSVANGQIMADFAVAQGRMLREEAGAWMRDLRRLGSQGRYFSASTVTCSSPPSDRKNFGTRRSHLPRQHRPRRRNDIVLGTDRRLGFRRDGTAATALASAAVVIAAPALAPAPPAVASSRQPR